MKIQKNCFFSNSPKYMEFLTVSPLVCNLLMVLTGSTDKLSAWLNLKIESQLSEFYAMRNKKYQAIVSVFFILAFSFFNSEFLREQVKAPCPLEEHSFTKLALDTPFNDDKINTAPWHAPTTDNIILYFKLSLFLPINFYCFVLFAYLNCFPRSPTLQRFKM